MTTSKLLVALLLGTLVCLNACKRADKEEGTFCNLLQQKKFPEASAHANTLLKQLPARSDKSLDVFRDWLDNNSCVEQAVIKCRSCIKTNPVQSLIHADYREDLTTRKIEISIRMDTTLSCFIHEI